MQRNFVFSALVVALATFGCVPGEIPYTDAGTASTEVSANLVCPGGTAEMQAQVLAARCAASGCHGPTMTALGLDLVSPDLEARLLNAPSIGCRGEKLVVPGQPELSQLFRKVADPVPECGLRMPVGPAFNADELECLRRWIASMPPGDGNPVDAGPDAPPGLACPSGQIICGSSCADTKVDNANCGVCGRTCGAGTTCSNGACACSGGQTLCGAACVDTASNGLHCGACGRACGAGQTCSGGNCQCAGGLTSCNGACVDVKSSAGNCGACGTVCGGGTVCSAGSCVRGGCPTGTTNCGGACVDTRTSSLNCGGCGVTCPSGQTCAGGACGCAAETTSCGALCVNTATDALNCGGCGKSCPAGSACAAGSCGCSAGLTACGSSCVNTATDSNNCGVCARVCSGGASCVSGSCSTTCASGTTLCSGSCVNTASDAKNCGSCGRMCGSGESCQSGVCVGCGPSVSFSGQVQPIFNASCTTNCHGGPRPAGGLSLVSGAAYAELVGVTSTCAGRKHVAPGSPQSSYLINKLTGVGMCSGSVMPKMGGELSAAQIDLIRGWICQGAPRN